MPHNSLKYLLSALDKEWIGPNFWITLRIAYETSNLDLRERMAISPLSNNFDMPSLEGPERRPGRTRNGKGPWWMKLTHGQGRGDNTHGCAATSARVVNAAESARMATP
jgi:hypothetical protein